jgi:UDP-3-O-[3-hydroxymyristoyl] glucosamine N-acyltransferase
MASIQSISQFIEATLIGNSNQEVLFVKSLDDPSLATEDLTWVSSKNVHKLEGLNTGNVICDLSTPKELFKKECNYLLVKNPRLAFLRAVSEFFVPKRTSETAINSINIHPSAKIGKNVFIGFNTIIEENCSIGDNSQLGHNNVIHSNTRIGENVKIGSNNTIGGVGFGYEKNELGKYEQIPHIGGVVKAKL